MALKTYFRVTSAVQMLEISDLISFLYSDVIVVPIHRILKDIRSKNCGPLCWSISKHWKNTKKDVKIYV